MSGAFFQKVEIDGDHAVISILVVVRTTCSVKESYKSRTSEGKNGVA